MTGHHKWVDLKSRLRADPVSNERYEPMRRATEDALRLGQLREARNMTQMEVAGILGSSQGNVSRMERRDELYLSTLSEYVEALGGRLELRAVFPDQTIAIEIVAAREPSPATS